MNPGSPLTLPLYLHLLPNENKLHTLVSKLYLERKQEWMKRTWPKLMLHHVAALLPNSQSTILSLETGKSCL